MTSKTTYLQIFRECHPGFFDNGAFHDLPEDAVYEEMFLSLKDFSVTALSIPVPEGVSFGRYHGNREALLSAVGKVDREWPQYFKGTENIFCAMVGNEIASFCTISDMGTHDVNGKTVRIGGPGCVGTVPEYRRQGIGLKMVQLATGLLRDEGYDISYIHYTGVAQWYARLGYETKLRWGRNGIIQG